MQSININPLIREAVEAEKPNMADFAPITDNTQLTANEILMWLNAHGISDIHVSAAFWGEVSLTFQVASGLNEKVYKYYSIQVMADKPILYVTQEHKNPTEGFNVFVEELITLLGKEHFALKEASH